MSLPKTISTPMDGDIPISLAINITVKTLRAFIDHLTSTGEYDDVQLAAQASMLIDGITARPAKKIFPRRRKKQ